MTSPQLLDAAGRRRSPATMPAFHRGRPPRNQGLQYPADPPTVEEIVAVVRCAGDRPYGLRTRARHLDAWIHIRVTMRVGELLCVTDGPRRSSAERGRWDWSRDLREQDGWEEHASSCDSLVNEGFVVLGGPLEGRREILHAISAPSEEAVR
jgi:hypothetical protein